MTDDMTSERADLLSRIAPVSDNPGPFKALIYGPKGAGKTVFCGRAKNCILLDTENGRKSMKNHSDTRRVPILDVKSFNDMDEIAWAYREGDLQRWCLTNYGMLSVDTFVVDTISQLAQDAASALLDKAVTKNPNRDPFYVSEAEYKVRNELFKRMTAEWSDLGVNFIFTAHRTEVKDGNDGRLFYRPSVSATMAESLGGLVDLQGYLTCDETEEPGVYVRHLQVHPTRRVDAKTRVGGLPPVMENPDINELIAANFVVADHDDKETAA